VTVFFTYIDWTLENIPRAFYVGKGTERRLKERERNSRWKRIAAKYGWRREPILATTEEAYAFEQEILGILELGTNKYSSQYRWGANMTAGGEGTTGHRDSQETRCKKGQASRLFMRTPKARERQRQRFVENNPMRKPEVVSKFKGKNHPQKRPEVRALRSGENSPHARTNWNDVNQIRTLYATGEYTQKQLGKKFGLSQIMISRIVTFQSWNPDNGNAEAQRQRTLHPRKR